MAKLNTSDMVAGNEIGIPDDNYLVRVTKIEQKTNEKKGCPQTNIELEIMSPDDVLVGDRKLRVAGLKTQCTFVHAVDETWGQARVIEFCKRAGFPVESYDDTDVFANCLKDARFQWALSSEEQVVRYPKDHPDATKRNKPILTAEGKQVSNGFRVTADYQRMLCAA